MSDDKSSVSKYRSKAAELAIEAAVVAITWSIALGALSLAVKGWLWAFGL